LISVVFTKTLLSMLLNLEEEGDKLKEMGDND